LQEAEDRHAGCEDALEEAKYREPEIEPIVTTTFLNV
jgi:hypothetical protein